MVQKTLKVPRQTKAVLNFIRVKQGQREFFLTKMPASVLAKISYASVRRQDDEEGAVQRILDPKRIADLKAFVLAGGDYPACIILNWVSTSSKLVEKNGKLSFTLDERLAQQVDGQHRVEGLRAAIKEEPSLASMEIPVVIYQDLKTKECADIFLSINAKQKPVARSLVTDLFQVASDYIVDPGAQRARYCRFAS